MELALIAWGIGKGDAVFVPDFTFFSSAEVISRTGATPIFVDVLEDTFNLSPDSLEEAISCVLEEGAWSPRAVIAVDLFGLPAEHGRIRAIAEKYHLKVLEDGAQGFGGSIHEKKACGFGDIGTTSFFPAKPLGCYGDGGAIFTDCDETARLLRSLRVHGKGEDKYDNVRIGMNSRLDTMQAAILRVKLKAFAEYELADVNRAAAIYSRLLSETDCKLPHVPEGMVSSWAQYAILLPNEKARDAMQASLRERGIPSMIYYKKTMHDQKAFRDVKRYARLEVSEDLCRRVLALPMHPYITESEQREIAGAMIEISGVL